MAIQPKGIILHSMSEYLIYEGQKLYAKDKNGNELDWTLDGMSEPGLYPIVPVNRDWYLESQEFPGRRDRSYRNGGSADVWD